MKLEQEIREGISLENQCLNKLDFIRNELIPYYGEDISLKDLEKSLWDQYLKFHKRVQEHFKMCYNENR